MIIKKIVPEFKSQYVDYLIIKIKEVFELINVSYKLNEYNTFQGLILFDNIVILFNLKIIEELNLLVFESNCFETCIFISFADHLYRYIDQIIDEINLSTKE